MLHYWRRCVVVVSPNQSVNHVSTPPLREAVIHGGVGLYCSYSNMWACLCTVVLGLAWSIAHCTSHLVMWIQFWSGGSYRDDEYIPILYSFAVCNVQLGLRILQLLYVSETDWGQQWGVCVCVHSSRCVCLFLWVCSFLFCQSKCANHFAEEGGVANDVSQPYVQVPQLCTTPCSCSSSCADCNAHGCEEAMWPDLPRRATDCRCHFEMHPSEISGTEECGACRRRAELGKGVCQYSVHCRDTGNHMGIFRHKRIHVCHRHAITVAEGSSVTSMVHCEDKWY